MQIPIQNIYYLLCYAWDKLDERDIVNVDTEGIKDILDLFAKVLISGTTYLFKKGLDRGYVVVEEDSRRIKGKIQIEPTLKHRFFARTFARCLYDELDYNVLHNIILKTTIRRLIKARDLENSLREELILNYRRFPPINEIDINAQHFRKVKLNRNNYFYDFLLKICEIIYWNLLPDEKIGDLKFRDFSRDPRQMSSLFEEFIRNFYKKEKQDYRVSREHIRWQLEAKGPFDMWLPRMETDVSLESIRGDHKVIIETKYYSKGFKTIGKDGEQEKLISSNLYQIYAYLKNLEGSVRLNSRCEGILLYALVEDDADLSFSLPGHRLRVKTLNLNQNWKLIHDSLISLICSS